MKNLNSIKPISLEGSEKQIAWAEEIRKPLIDALNEDLESQISWVREFVAGKGPDYFGKEQIDEYIDESLELAENLITTVSNAKWWIDYRDAFAHFDPDEFILHMYIIVKEGHRPEAVGDKKQVYMAYAEEKDPEAAGLMFPEDKITSNIVTVKQASDKVLILFNYNKDLVNIVKSLGCRWSNVYWEKAPVEGINTLEDTAAEVINGLLNAGIPVRCRNAEVRAKAMSGDYTPTPTRVIKTNKEGKILIEWTERKDDIYQDARAIKSSKYSKPSVVVDAEQYVDIEGFAEKWGFAITPKAQEKLDEEKERVLTHTVKVAKPKTYEHREFNGEAVLQSEATVLEKHKLI